MNYKYVILFSILVFSLSISAVYAESNDSNLEENNILENQEKSPDNSIQTIQSTTKVVKQAQIINTVTPDTYNQYFKINSTNETSTTGQVYLGDTINLEGTFENVNFTLDKNNITLTSINKKAKLINCTVYVCSDNCNVYNLTINNTNSFGLGVLVKDCNNVTVSNNSIFVQNLYAFGIACNNMNNSILHNNSIISKRLDNAPLFSNYKQCAMVLCTSFNNRISNNKINCTFANGIYLSIYGSIFLTGGVSDNNLIEGNYVLGGDSVWCYTIQVMGSNNIVRNNTVIGGHRGVSCEASKNNTIVSNNIKAIMQGVHAGLLDTVLNNTVDVNQSAVGVYTGESDVQIKNNKIYSDNAAAVKLGSGNINISNNSIISYNSYGIYSKGSHKNINITNNNITSQDTGIFFEKQSQKKRLNNIYANNNKITSKAEYAIDFSQTGSVQVDDINVVVSNNNVLSSSRGNGLTNAYLAPAYQSSTVVAPGVNVTITQDNYSQYFNIEGIQKSQITPNSNVTLSGQFNNVNFEFIDQVHVKGKNCIINMGTIILSEEASLSTISNIRINNTEKTNNINRHGVELIGVNNCNLTNITIENYDLAESMGILLHSSSGNTITNNHITTSGNYVNDGIFIYSSDLNIIKNNSIFINQSNNPYEHFDEIMFNEKLGTIKSIDHEHGIILVYSVSNLIDHNIIQSKSQFAGYTRPNELCENTITGIKLYHDSHLNNITYNQVYMDSHGPYTYGMAVVGAPENTMMSRLNSSNNSFRKNTVKVIGGYFTCGFMAGYNSLNTLVNQNTITITPIRNNKYYADYGYGIILNYSRNLTLTNNNITSKGSATYNIQIYHSNYNTMENNTFKVKGTMPYGVASEVSTHNNIKSNIFDITQKNYGGFIETTFIPPIEIGDNGVLLSKKSHNNSITANTIKTNADWAVFICDDCVSNNVTNNSLQAKKLFGDNAVNNTPTSSIIKNNYLYPIKASAKNVNGIVGSNITLIAYMSSRTTDVKNVTATFRLGSTTIGTAKINNGKTNITYQIPTYWRSGNYDVIVFMSGTNFQNTTAKATAVISANAIKTTITANKVYGLPGETVKINATVKDIYGNNMNGKVEFILNGKSLANVTLTDAKASVSYKIPVNNAITTIPLIIKYLGNDQYAPSDISTILGVQSKVTATVYYSNATIGSPITFKAKFTENSKALKSGKVAVKINGLTIGTTNIVDGIATFNYVVPVGYSIFQKHVVQFVYGGTDTLTSVRAEKAFDVYAMKTKVVLNKTTAKVGQNITMKVLITNQSQTHFPVSGKVALKINGITVKDTSGNPIVAVPQNGMVSIKIPITKSLIGSNTITVTYSGNNRLTGAREEFPDVLVVKS